MVLYAASREFVPLYAVYALLFRDTGLSVAQISSLFAIWTLVSFALEVPSGALADVVSRRLLLVVAALLAAASFATWVLVPTYLGFAVGFVLWGIGGALQSGTFEALLYDALAREGRTSSYAGLAGTAEAASTTSTLVALLVASPLLLSDRSSWSVGPVSPPPRSPLCWPGAFRTRHATPRTGIRTTIRTPSRGGWTPCARERRRWSRPVPSPAG